VTPATPGPITPAPEVPRRVIAGCEPFSHACGSSVGVLVVHGFTGSPFSVRGVADAVAGGGFDVEVPRLPGHGTDVADMVTTGWGDWSAAVVDAFGQLSARTDRVVMVGQSMGATLALWAALRGSEPAGIVCINPVTRARSTEEIALIDGLLEDGINVAPGEGSDIADPDSYDITYDGTPLAPIRSFLVDGVAAITDRFGELAMPLRLFTSRNDHVVDPADSDHLAESWGGSVERTWLERSYHVATRDFDRGAVESGTVEFVRRIAS
jgi:carboxylesterase